MQNWKNNFKPDGGELVTNYFSKYFNTAISIRLMGTADRVHPEQEALITELIDNERNWVEESVHAILEYYKEVYPDYRMGWELGGGDEASIEACLPKEIDRAKLLKLITPSEIYIAEEESIQPGTFGFGLECEWDVEHGLGVSFSHWNVREVGGMDVAFGY